MDRTPLALWAKHLIRAAIEYFNERSVQACLIVDNTILKDGVLSAITQDSNSSDFIVCVAPGFTTQLDFGDDGVTISVRFNEVPHSMSIPYHAVKAVIAANSNGVLTENGHLNLISIPPVVYPPASRCRNKEELDRLAQQAVEDEIHAQPAQSELQLYARRS
ncbi:ClpXP protease specificity-enhancing factor [compost metagenome]